METRGPGLAIDIGPVTWLNIAAGGTGAPLCNYGDCLTHL